MEGQKTEYRPRLFTGLALTPEVREHIAGISRRMSGEIEGVRWVPAENLHVTLKFIGWCEQEKIPRIIEAMSEAAAQLPIELSIGGPGGFPSSASARVIWVGAEDRSGRLSTIFRIIERGAEGCGFPREKRGYRPHVTIGRAKKKPVRLPAGPPGESRAPLLLEVEDLVLFRSELKSTGAEYSVVERVRPVEDR